MSTLPAPLFASLFALAILASPSPAIDVPAPPRPTPPPAPLAATEGAITPRTAAAASKPKFKPLPPGVVQIRLDDLHCKTCATKLARKLYAVPGVVRVRSNLKQDMVTITLQKKKQVAANKLWEAAIAAEMQPVELRFADRLLTKKHFPQTKTAAKPAKSVPH